MHIERVTGVDDGLVAAVAKLIPQLNPRSPVPTRDDLALMVASPGTHLLLARDPDIIGTLTLTVFRTLVGVQARINTVVVDAGARGRGIGEALTREAIAIARTAGAKAVSLTSRPDREAANRLYQRLGFEPVHTNAYRYRL
jgi:ribosomal protein S18 acetylase RimI-like enzyme